MPESREPPRRRPIRIAKPWGSSDARVTAIKGDNEVLQHLNNALLNNLTAVNQYFLHARMFGNWGLKKFEDYEKSESIDEMKHADRLVERILFLPNLQDLGKLMIGEDVSEALACDLMLDKLAHPDLKFAIEHCESAGDYVSRELFSCSRASSSLRKSTSLGSRHGSG